MTDIRPSLSVNGVNLPIPENASDAELASAIWVVGKTLEDLDPSDETQTLDFAYALALVHQHPRWELRRIKAVFDATKREAIT